MHVGGRDGPCDGSCNVCSPEGQPAMGRGCLLLEPFHAGLTKVASLPAYQGQEDFNYKAEGCG